MKKNYFGASTFTLNASAFSKHLIQFPSGRTLWCLHGGKCGPPEWRWWWEEGRDTVDHWEQSLICSHSISLVFSTSHFCHLCPWVFFGVLLGWSSFYPSVLQAAASWLVSFFNPLPSTFQLSEISGNVLFIGDSTICFSVLIWYFLFQCPLKCWRLVHHLEVVLLRKGKNLTFYRNVQKYNRTSQFYFLSSFHSACYLWLSR